LAAIEGEQRKVGGAEGTTGESAAAKLAAAARIEAPILETKRKRSTLKKLRGNVAE
jgi:hypothetical protein